MFSIALLGARACVFLFVCELVVGDVDVLRAAVVARRQARRSIGRARSSKENKQIARVCCGLTGFFFADL